MNTWFEKPGEQNPAEDLKQVVNSPPTGLPLDEVARRSYYFSEWMKKTDRHYPDEGGDDGLPF